MRTRIITATMFSFLFLSISFAYSAIVYVDPASQDSPSVGKTIEFAVKVKDVVDLTAYQIEISFDKTAIELISIEEGSFLKTGFGNDPEVEGTVPFITTTVTEPPKSTPFDSITPDVYADVNSGGEMVIANSRYSKDELKGVDGEGNLLNIKFEVLIAKASKIQLNAPFDDPNLILVNSKLAVIDTQLAGATINEPPACVKGDVNEDGEVNSKDALLTLRISAEIIVPTPEQFCAADIDDNQKVNSLDAIKILRKSAGLGAPVKDATANLNIVLNIASEVKLGEVYGKSGDSISVPMYITYADMIAGGDIIIIYDPKILKASEVLSDQNALLIANTSKSGIVNISFADSMGIAGDTLAEIKFDVIADNISRLSLQQVTLYSDNLQPIIPKKQDGKFTSWAMPAKDNVLLQNFPNPFNPETWIPFLLKQDTDVVISIYSAAGELVRELNLGNKPAGMYVSQDRAAYWDGKDKFGIPVASGVYFYSVRTKDFSSVKKLIVLK